MQKVEKSYISKTALKNFFKLCKSVLNRILNILWDFQKLSMSRSGDMTWSIKNLWLWKTSYDWLMKSILTFTAQDISSSFIKCSVKISAHLSHIMYGITLKNFYVIPSKSRFCPRKTCNIWESPTGRLKVVFKVITLLRFCNPCDPFFDACYPFHDVM